MKKAINLLFWGYLVVLVRIDFGLDVLPVPLGYFIIATGCKQLEKKYPVAQKAWGFTTAMIFISFPTIFLDVHQQTHILWKTYSLFIMIGQLIVVYFILSLLKDIVLDYGNSIFSQRLKLMTKIYIISHLLYFTASTFTLNIALDDWLFFMTIFMFVILIMDIIFLVLLREVRKIATNKKVDRC